ncbi:Outer membrane protein OmpA [Meinhardsimonia xiamenensis]|jgi:outer membrane protein OmpA-like peptidoglycan-associated protein|uniref:Outer membrane protein OmpA n=1 Tax=Meinhardsimonia xiamenensis TaxID=990712 RepID=A0A1G9DXQ3_9RHOB|nr:OmpA family protein [Meinhardsimonia xiamenensis]PRX31152.1 outer membrane protein OmpA-like peptidoglycan-associated protein [Meinhardsimonia xiamenensis]SDK68656.1 Outer membrane protein OmpA [Meinhardsimonia xiamenensis]
MILRTVVSLVAAAALLAACADPETDPRARTKTGALLGGLTGALIGSQIDSKDGNNTEGIIIGGVAGALTGAAIGDALDKQAAELRQRLDGRVRIVRQGDELVVVMPNDILFEFDSAEVAPELVPDLRELAASLKRYPGTIVEVQGHTDGVGSAAYNLRLSKERADNVRAILVGAGVEPSRVIAVGMGENVLPPGVSAIPENNPLRRRVEIYIRPAR